jgi:cell shape-determining protein MreC
MDFNPEPLKEIKPLTIADIMKSADNAMNEHISETNRLFENLKERERLIKEREKQFLRKTTLATIFIGIVGILATIATMYLAPDKGLKLQEEQLKELKQLNYNLKEYLTLKTSEAKKTLRTPVLQFQPAHKSK